MNVVVRERERVEPQAPRRAAVPWLLRAVRRRWRSGPRSALPATPWAAWLTVAALALGTALRLRQYQFRRSLWTDESMLALNVVHRGYIGLTKPLDLLQGAPIGFLWVQRASVDVFGNNELALRLFPLIAGIASLFMVARLARRLLPQWAVPVAVLVVATLPSLIYYSDEAKQYSVDVAATLLVVLTALRLLEWPESRRMVLRFGIVGAVAVLFSHPAALVLAASTGLAAIVLIRRRRWRGVVILAGGAAIWEGMFLVQYFRSLHALAGTQVLRDFWAAGYPPRHASVTDVLGWAQHAVAGLVPNPIPVGHPALLLVLVVAGFAVLLRQRWKASTLFLLVATGALSAAVLELYPLRWRLALYLVPIILVTAVASLDAGSIAKRAGRPLRVVSGVAAAAVLIPVAWTPVHDSFHAAAHPYTVTEMRPLIEHLADGVRPGDAVYVHWAASAEFEYYRTVLTLPRYRRIGYDPWPDQCDDGVGLADAFRHPRVWIVLGSPPVFDKADTNALTLAHFDTIGHRLEDLKAPGKAEVALYDRLQLPPPPRLPPRSPHGGLCLHVGPLSAND